MAGSVSEWTKVLIHPLGLVGYVVFLLFGLLARATRKSERRWVLATVLIAAGVALLGGLGLAYRDVSRPEVPSSTTVTPPNPTPTPASAKSASGDLKINGDNNQVFKDLKSDGDMTINAGENSGNKQTPKTTHKKP